MLGLVLGLGSVEPLVLAALGYSVYHHSYNASVITSLPAPVSAKMYHGFKY